jgi:plasmid stabilization system protein ParE
MKNMASRPKPVIFSPQTLRDLDGVYEYINYRFGKTTLLKFDKKWKSFLVLISLHPAIFPCLNKSKNLRKHTFYNRNLVVYKNTRRHIEIIAVFNTWQNPDKLKKLR